MTLFLLRLSCRWNRYLAALHEVSTHQRLDLRSPVLSPQEQTRLMILRTALQGAVPIGILDLKRRGGPSWHDWEWLQDPETQEWLMVKTEGLVCGDGRAHPDVMGKICRVVSILAFVPGGVTLFGLTFEAEVVTGGEA